MNLVLADLHCHTYYSHDSNADLNEIVNTAVEKGISVLALTDHLDLDFGDYGMTLDIDLVARKNEILALKEEYRKKITLIYGIELGQPLNYPELAEKAVKDGGFEFVLGAIHNLKNMPDFYYINYSKLNFENKNEIGLANNLFKRYLDDTYVLTTLPYIDSVAHCTYPCRYMKAGGLDFDITPFYPDYERIFKSIVKNGKMLEINTSNIRRGFGFTMPDADLLQLYKDCGGKYVTIGSDAHRPHEVGADIEVGYKKATEIGLEVVTEIKEKY